MFVSFFLTLNRYLPDKIDAKNTYMSKGSSPNFDPNFKRKSKKSPLARHLHVERKHQGLHRVKLICFGNTYQTEQTLKVTLNKVVS